MSNPLPVAFVTHSVPGRVRIRIPSMRNQEEYFARLRDKLTSVPGLQRITTNMRTGSVLLEYSGELEPLAGLGSRLEAFALGDRPHPHSLSEWIYTVVNVPDHLLKQATDGRVDLAGVAALSLTGFGIRQIARGQALPAGLTLLWNAWDLVRAAAPKPDGSSSNS